ncbi:Pisatin demethylase [Madurella mycetomatis]|uniref:Pisatin demethylase n=1 Tax=Madurella mycetomatis TaxID=100816 RepID=A0A175VU44_9PEZI|nr:Pisatin demethylase [Madurella mycetomatis]
MALHISAVYIGGIGILILWVLFTRIRNWYALRHIPGPRTAGWSKFWLVRRQINGRLLQDLRDVSKKYGPVARIGPRWVVVSSPSEIRRIWSIRSGYQRSPWYRGFRFDPNSDSVITMVDNKEHLRLRTHLGPAYQARGITNQEQVVDEQIAKLIDFITRKYLSKPGTAAEGAGYGRSIWGANDDLYGAIDALQGMLLPCAVMGLLPPVLWFVTSPLCKPFMPRKTDKSGIGRLLGVLDERVRARYGEKKVKNMDVLQGLVESGLSREEVEAEALVHLLGGTDTTAGALRNTVFFLATCPAAYRRLQDEIDSVAGRVTRPVIADAECKELKFLQACIKESLRLWPPLSGLQAKMSSNDDVVCGLKVPAGTHVAFGYFEVMRDKDLFGENADMYEPMRWLEADPEKLKEMEATGGMAFAAGTRWECLGKRLANLQMGKVLFELFLRFDFAMTDPVKPFDWKHMGFTLQDDMNVTITERKPRGVV